MRARNIKPGFFENEELAELSFEARLLYVGLWCYADREGCFEWRPKRIKALIFPYNDCDIERLLMSLHDTEFIVKYQIENKFYGYIPKFLEHQRPHPHEAKSNIPKFIEENQCHDMSNQSNEMSMECTSDIINDDIINEESDKSPSGGHFSNKVGNYLDQIKNHATKISNLPLKRKINVWRLIQQWANAEIHPGAIEETLSGALPYLEGADNPEGYLRGIMKTKAQNWREKGFIQAHEKENEEWQELVRKLKALNRSPET